jgi:hypothetical protein
MIADLDKTLEELLKRDLPTVTVSFDPPDDKFAPALPALDLFLYDVRENRELRTNQPAVERDGSDAIARRRPAVRIDCSYLVTAWASDAQNEHLLLSEALKVLLRYPTLPRDVLKGSLQGQDLPLPTSTLQPSLLQSVGEFWQAMGGKPKAAFNYSVTISMEVFEIVEGPLVVEKTIRFSHYTREGAR